MLMITINVLYFFLYWSPITSSFLPPSSLPPSSLPPSSLPPPFTHQCLIIALLLLNLASRFNVVNSHSVYTGNMVIHVIELGLPIWFCCTLWNFKRLVL